MIKKDIIALCIFIFLTFLSLEAWAGELMWGPKKYTRDTGEPVTVVDSLIINQPAGKFYIHIKNGGSVPKPGAIPGIVDPVDQASSAYIKINGVQVVGPQDLNQNTFGIDKDITLEAFNKLEVEVRGKPGSYIMVEIRRANLNEMVGNKNYDLRGINMKNQIALWWSEEEGASWYVIYKAYSMDEPWIALGRIPLAKGVDITPEAQTKDLCYKIDALDSSNKVIRQYDPICVPKWQEESSLPLTQKITPKGSAFLLSKGGPVNPFFKKGGDDPSFLPSFKHAIFSSPAGIKRLSTASTQSTQSVSQPYNTMCLGDDEFVDTSTMTYDDIKKFLKDKGSFLKEDEVMDVDGASFDPAGIIDFAAHTYGINPQVLLTTLQKENGAVKSTIRLPDKDLRHIMGYGSPSTIVNQILDAAAQFGRDFDRLSNGQATLSGWKVGVTILSGEPNPGDEKDASGNSIPVTPANKAVTILFTYTPWVGQGWGGNALIGGNALFCQLWDEFGFVRNVTVIETFIQIFIGCTSTGQLCSPPFSTSIQTESLLQAEYTTPSAHCSSISLHIFVDGALRQVTGFLDADESTGLLNLGPVSSGIHLLSLQAEGRLGGCNFGDLVSWGGNLRVLTSSF